ncbi:MAG: hypothetical protein JKY07_01115 [SAR324 cluster bacterium]|jgi:hypothetical protein|nr:hypothetical protein [SAR324 cluster bacterium]|tara:strand:+ start:106 stop:297 length:192 start_codon:yes stop_codon:yes gene_type:complete
MDIQTNEIIKILIDYKLLVFPILGLLATLLLVLTWRQASRSWCFYFSKRKLLENLQYTLQHGS